MSGSPFLQNSVLLAALVAWMLAQIFKVPLQYLREGEWDWTVLVRPGGMPSSHSALITAGAHGVGLTVGFDSPVFALAVVIAMIVIYDATGVRRQAGRHAEIINTIIRDLFEGHQLNQEQLREVLGHSPIEALVGLLLGLTVAQVLVPLLEGLI
ncbi:MAG: divergent PAP2 family protein [Anaerolineales bacterium]